jgi:hypothetical protein
MAAWRRLTASTSLATWLIRRPVSIASRAALTRYPEVQVLRFLEPIRHTLQSRRRLGTKQIGVQILGSTPGF